MEKPKFVAESQDVVTKTLLASNFNSPGMNKKRCKQISDALMGTKDIKDLIILDIAREIAEYSVVPEAECIDCSHRFTIEESEYWIKPDTKYKGRFQKHTFYDLISNIYIHERVEENRYQYTVVCGACSMYRECQCGGILFQKPYPDFTSAAFQINHHCPTLH